MLLNSYMHTGGLKCIHLVNVQQKGTDEFPSNSQVIVPRISFPCNGRITGYVVSLKLERKGKGNKEDEPSYPVIQVWRPLNTINPSVYTIVKSLCTPTASNINKTRDSMGDEYYLGNVSCAGNNSVEFQSGDVIGYHQTDDSQHYKVWNIEAAGYVSHYTEGGPLDSFTITDDADESEDDQQPLIQLIFGKVYSCSETIYG